MSRIKSGSPIHSSSIYSLASMFLFTDLSLFFLLTRCDFSYFSHLHFCLYYLLKFRKYVSYQVENSAIHINI